MMKKLMNPLRILAMMVVVIGLLVNISCNGDDDKPTTCLDEGTCPTISGILSADEDFFTIDSLLNADADYKGMIEGTTEYTLFAPSEEGFARLRRILGVEDLTTIAPDVITQVLDFHFVSGTILKEDLPAGASVTTIEGSNITITNDGNHITEAGSDADGSEIYEADLYASNGVVHKVETILIPPALFGFIADHLGTLGQPTFLGAAFTDVTGIIRVADSADLSTGESTITEILSDKENKYTAFFPTNEVLNLILGESKDATIASLTSSPAVARGFILNHITSGEINEDDLVHGSKITMLSGLELTVVEVPVSASTPTGWVLACDPANSDTYLPIFGTDVYQASVPDPENPDGVIELPSALNGTLHVGPPITGCQ